ncbi:hypothetical protein BKA66DRAFT_81711 [Pyrenochaeta sp. MPI-SDFR-AT-0127]|nr:hypothetical protein BKA66DRAFT_81711 [Pyrenochaeta sp. MPI-SDFR-AT-0127]
MDPTPHNQEASALTERTQSCLSLIKQTKNEPVGIFILLGETGAGKSSLLEYLTGVQGHSMEAAESVTKVYQIEKMDIKSHDYYIMDTPGFDYGSESEVFREVVSGIGAISPHARIIGVLLVTSMHHTRVSKMDEKLLRFTREFCGDEYLPQVTDVTTFWETHSETQKQLYDTRLANRLEKVKELWSVQGHITHYQHGRKYDGERDTGISLEWDKDRDEMAGYAKDMVLRHYGSINPREPRIVQDLRSYTFEHTAAGQSLGLIPELTKESTLNLACSSSSAVLEPEEQNTEKLKQDSLTQEPSKEDPPQLSSSLDETLKQEASSHTNEKGFWDYALDVVGTVVRNIDFNVTTGSTMSNTGINFGGSPLQSSPPHIPIERRYHGLMDHNSVVDAFKVRGWDSDPASRARVGQQLGISGTPGSGQYNDELRKKVQKFY